MTRSRRGLPLKTCHSYGMSKEAFGLSDRLLRKLPSNVLGASKLFKWNWGVPQFHKRLRVLINAHHKFRQITASLSSVWRENEQEGGV
jgi:hypothetical protein